DDSLALPIIALGGIGVISAVANLVPAEMARLSDAALAGRWDEARRVHYSLLPLIRACFVETNPIPIKAAMGLLGRCEDELRLPLLRMSDKPREALRAALAAFGLQVARS